MPQIMEDISVLQMSRTSLILNILFLTRFWILKTKGIKPLTIIIINPDIQNDIC